MGRPKKKIPDTASHDDKLEKLQTLLSEIDIDTLTTALELLKKDGGQNQVESDSPIHRRKKRVVGKSTSKNRFDTMKFQGKELNVLKEASAEDKKLLKNWNPVPRVRGSNLVNVKCRKCGKEERVSTSIILDRDRYLCNKCIINRGD